jgi:hypothetical protein
MAVMKKKKRNKNLSRENSSHLLSFSNSAILYLDSRDDEG